MAVRYCQGAAKTGCRALIAIAGGLAALAGPRVAPAQQPPEQTVKSMTAADGLEVKLFAAEPMVVNPIAIDVDTYGRVWVTEGTKYRSNVANPPNDKIKVLEDTNGDGLADKMTVFTSDLNAAMGVCVAGGRIYVPESPHLYVYEDQNLDLVPDGPRKVLLTGFGGKNHDHGVHSQVFGPDHKLYMTNGDTGYNVTGPDGRTIKYQWGAMIRCEADGTLLEDFAVNFRNPVELAVDSFGNVWCSDNDNDGLKSVRICWILEGGNYGWFGRPEEIRNPDGSFDPVHHWRADKPGFVPYVLITGFGSPCGMTFYESDLLGPRYQNQLLHCDAGPREIRCYFPRRAAGVGFTALQENLVTSTDSYFRPVDPCVAPDGSIYVTDWYDGGVGGHAYNDPTRGRIYRITAAGRQPSRKEKPGPYQTDEEALAALASPNHATTFLARERLLASGERAVGPLTKLAAGNDRVLKARALWLLDRIGGAGREAVLAELRSSDPAFRALAVRILRRHGDRHLPALLELAQDADGEVVKEVLLAAGASTSKAAFDVLVAAFARYDGDRYLLETLGIAASRRGPKLFEAVAGRDDAELTPRLVDVVRVLRPAEAARYLSARLAKANLPEASTKALLDALAAVTAPDAGKPVVALLTSEQSPQVRRLALDALRRNLPGAWSALKNDSALKEGLQKSLADRAVAVPALAVVTEAALREYAGTVVELLADDASTRDTKLAAIAAVERLNLGAAVAPLVRLLASSDAPLRGAALRALVLLRDGKALAGLLTDGAMPTALKEQALDLLTASSDGAVLAFRLVDSGRLDRALAQKAIEAGAEHPDVNVRLLFEKFIPAGQRPKTLGQEFTAEQILALAGDAARGEQVFLRSGAASCNKCHRVRGKGSDIGPELSQIGRKYERKALLETIMNPSAGIAPEYVPYVVETESGRVHAGFLKEQNDQRIVLKTIEGAVVEVPRDQIVELSRQSTSLMPELVLKNVTAQDAADLLAYLAGLQETVVHAMKLSLVGPFPNVRPEHRLHDFGPEKSAGAFDGKAQYEGFGKKQLGWTRIEGRPGNSGIPEFDLRTSAVERNEPADNVIYYLAAVLDSATSQPATLYVGSDDGVQVWLNGQKVHDHKVTRGLTAAEDKVQVKLRQGRNQLLVKVDQGNGPSGLTLSAEARDNLSFTEP
jgi:putative membrane-bound dehydrogenase-like protein